MIDDFVIRAFAAGSGVALLAAPLGCFIVWRRMAFFGDAIAHSALLGIALGFVLGTNLTIGVLIATIAMALSLVLLQRRKLRLPSDALLGVLAHAALSLGLVAIGLMTWLRIDLAGYLFGDILAVTANDLYTIYGGVAVGAVGLALLWRPLLAATVHEDLARAEGIATGLLRFGFMVLVALMTALAMKVVGILLITALLIIPAAAGRRFASTPEQMALAAAVIALLAVALGLAASVRLDTPSGPSIVVAATVLFALALLPFERAWGGLRIRHRARR